MLFSRAIHSVSQAAWQVGALALSAYVVLVSAGCDVYDAALVNVVAAGRDRDAAASLDNPLIAVSTAPVNGRPEPGPDDPFVFGESEDGGDSDAGTNSGVKCGDGEVTGIEKCDIAIPQGEPGACPETCPSLAKCVPRIRNGTGCQTECVLRGLTCESGDGCCPGNCTTDNDLDCSARCGDGIVQQSSGETCEPGSAAPCKSDAAECDDGDACTIDRLTGSETNCNSACTFERIQRPDPGDGCCPSGANANTDPDCSPKCGNAVIEQGEDCDGGQECDPYCKYVNAKERMQCLDSAQDDCERCACMQCTATELACRMGPDRLDNELCGNILRCSQRERCLGNSCYCGDSLGCTLPNGPCRNEVEAAAGILLQVAQQVGDPNTPLGRSYAADQCRVMKCESACRE